MADLVFRSNLVGDGSAVDDNPFTDAVRDAQMAFFVDGEVVPNGEDTRCIVASSIGPSYGNIPSGDTNEHVLTIGPIDESLVDSVVVGMRAFIEPGIYVPAEFTIEDGSGVVGDVQNAFD